MTTVTNKYGLPQVLANLYGKREYSRGHARWSVTSLIAPPKIIALREAHSKEIAENQDLSDAFWALMGSNIHRILQDGGDDVHQTEERIFTEIDGWTISGQIDVQQLKDSGIRIIDWKFTSVWAVQNEKPEWEEQLNSYAYLVEKERGHQIDSIAVCAILKDWRKMDLKRRKDYPPAPVIVLEQKLWPYDIREHFVKGRLRRLADATAALDLGLPLPDCSAEDRWERDGVSIRCENFCEVSQWCSQYAALKEQQADLPEKPKVTRKRKVSA